MLNKIVTDLETSKKLRELGVELRTELSWYGYQKLDRPKQLIVDIDPVDNGYETFTYIEDCFTLEQILEVLPSEKKWRNINLQMAITKRNYDIIGDNYDIGWHYPGGQLNTISPNSGENLATCAAKLLIELIEDKVITVEDVNKTIHQDTNHPL